jgi:hypothetical protein
MKQRIVPKSRILPDLALVASRPQPLSRAVRQFSFCSGWHSLDATTMSSNPPAIVGMSESAQTLHQPSVEIQHIDNPQLSECDGKVLDRFEPRDYIGFEMSPAAAAREWLCYAIMITYSSL